MPRPLKGMKIEPTKASRINTPPQLIKLLKSCIRLMKNLLMTAACVYISSNFARPNLPNVNLSLRRGAP